MDSLFKNNLVIPETDNIFYNILNTENKQFLFMYFMIMIFAIFVSNNIKCDIKYSINMVISILFGSIIIYYLYTHDKTNNLTQNTIIQKKFDVISSENNILEEYPEIINFLFDMNIFKNYNFKNYLKLVSEFEIFTKNYEYCIVDNNLINKYYSILLDNKINILETIDNFTHIIDSNVLYDLLQQNKQSAEKITNNMLKNINNLQKQNIYHNGYNINTKIIFSDNIKPFNQQ